jgi:membrane protease YdiL (CAAX protease family)
MPTTDKDMDQARQNQFPGDHLRGTRLIAVISVLVLANWIIPYPSSLLLNYISAESNNFARAVTSVLIQITAILGITTIGLKFARLNWADIGFPSTQTTFKQVLMAGILGTGFGVIIKLYDFHPAVWLPGFAGAIHAARIILISPFLEELFCRGLIFSLLESRTTPITNIFFNAVIYALTHYHFANLLATAGLTDLSVSAVSWSAISTYLILGILCSTVRYFSKSIWPAVSTHAAYNLVLFSI